MCKNKFSQSWIQLYEFRRKQIKLLWQSQYVYMYDLSWARTMHSTTTKFVKNTLLCIIFLKIMFQDTLPLVLDIHVLWNFVSVFLEKVYNLFVLSVLKFYLVSPISGLNCELLLTLMKIEFKVFRMMQWIFLWTCFFWQSLQSFVNKHLGKLSLEVADIDSQVWFTCMHMCMCGTCILIWKWFLKIGSVMQGCK